MGKYSEICSAVQARLEFCSGAGRILDGYRIELEPVERVEGESNLPLAGVQGLSIKEQYQVTSLVDAVVQIDVQVACSLSRGIAGLSECIEKVLTAIETDTVTGQMELSLGSKLVEWVETEITPAVMTNLSLSAVITVTAKLKHFDRRTRA